MIEPLRLFCIHFRKQVKFEDTQGSELLSIFAFHLRQATVQFSLISLKGEDITSQIHCCITVLPGHEKMKDDVCFAFI